VLNAARARPRSLQLRLTLARISGEQLQHLGSEFSAVREHEFPLFHQRPQKFIWSRKLV
jgi:hypothetical protein